MSDPEVQGGATVSPQTETSPATPADTPARAPDAAPAATPTPAPVEPPKPAPAADDVPKYSQRQYSDAIKRGVEEKLKEASTERQKLETELAELRPLREKFTQVEGQAKKAGEFETKLSEAMKRAETAEAQLKARTEAEIADLDKRAEKLPENSRKLLTAYKSDPAKYREAIEGLEKDITAAVQQASRPGTQQPSQSPWAPGGQTQTLGTIDPERFKGKLNTPLADAEIRTLRAQGHSEKDIAAAMARSANQ